MSRTAARSVTVIPPTINPLTHLSKVTMQKRRVAGYARVSTDSDEQFTSYEAQVDYYTQYIKRNPEWDFVKVYTDEGISGTNTKHRIGFNEMIADAMSGKIDLIVTKSISRFARNTVDSLVTIQKLKEKGVEVFFEKENIYTFDGKGELLLTISRALPRKRATRYQRMSHGDRENALQIERSPCRISSFSDTERERTVFQRLCRKKRSSSVESTHVLWKGLLRSPLQRN